MSDLLYKHYERELHAIRRMSRQFAHQYPATAGRLLLDPNGSADPHVERLLEGFAFLTGRVQQRLDDDFPELTDALLSILYPHYLAPIPTMSIVQFDLDPTNASPDGVAIPRGAKLRSQRIGATQARFRTCYDVTLWPVQIERVELDAMPLPERSYAVPANCASALRMGLTCRGQFTFDALTSLDSLRLHINATGEMAAQLYEMIFNRALRVEIRSADDPSKSVVLDPDEALRPVGFGRDEGLLPYPSHAYPGYRLLTEFFAFPDKFQFVDLKGFDRLRGLGVGTEVEVIVYFDAENAALERELRADVLRLGCAPVVNLFEKTAEPISLSQTQFEYAVTPDVHRRRDMEIYSIDRVTSVDPRDSRQYKPFYSFRHDSPWRPDDDRNAYWYARRVRSLESPSDADDVFLRLVDLDFHPKSVADSVIVVHATCSNHDLPIRLQQAGETLQLELEAAVPLRATRCLRTPTAPLRPRPGRHAYWRLLSHLSLNHLSLSDPTEGRAALREMLRLYDFASSGGGADQAAAVNQQIVEGVTSVSNRRVARRIGDPLTGGFCRGVEVEIEFDPQRYVGVNLFLFACVLNHFVAQYCSINSFTQLVAKTGENDVLRRFHPRIGEEPLL